MLIIGGADPNARGAEQVTPLHVAARSANILAIAALIDGGANLDPSLPTSLRHRPPLELL